MPAGLTAKQLSISYHATCAIMSNDNIYCWGKNIYGILGIGQSYENTAVASVPTAVTMPTVNGNLLTAKQVASLFHSKCAIMNDDNIYCWGKGHHYVPTAIEMPSGLKAKKLSAGHYHICSIMDNDSLYCFGENEYGRLGIGSTTDQSTLQAVDIPAKTWIADTWTAGTWNSALSASYVYGSESAATGGTSQVKAFAYGPEGLEASASSHKKPSSDFCDNKLPGTLVSQANDLYMCLGDECAETSTCEYRENGNIDKTVFKTRTCSHDMQHYTGLRDECPVGKCRIDERHQVKKTCHQAANAGSDFNGEIGVAAGQCERLYNYTDSTAIFSGTACTDASDCEAQCAADADCEGFTYLCSDEQVCALAFSASSDIYAGDSCASSSACEIACSKSATCMGYTSGKETTFGPMNTIHTKYFGSSDVRNFEMGDLDGDGDQDIIIATFYTVTWYENLDGKGNYGAYNGTHNITGDYHIMYAPTSTGGGYIKNLKLADINGDGKIDVIFSDHNGGKIYWFKNNGNKTFTENVISDAHRLGEDNIDTGDLDNDGDLDFILFTNDKKLQWYENVDGQGTFNLPANVIGTYNVGSTRINDDGVSVADIDGDGYIDVLLAGYYRTQASPYYNYGHFFGWYKNKGDKTFEARSDLAFPSASTIVPDTTGWVTSYVSSWYVVPRDIIATDIDGDGDMDIVASIWYTDIKKAGDIVWYENLDGQGTFSSSKTIDTRVDNAQSLVANDLDNDGDMDILCVEGKYYGSISYRLLYYENLDGNGTFSTYQQVGYSNGVEKLTVGDVNGDGFSDVMALVTSNSITNENVRWFENIPLDAFTYGVIDNSITVATQPGPTIDHVGNNWVDITTGYTKGFAKQGFIKQSTYGALTAASGGASKQRDDVTLAIEVTEDCTSSASVHCSDPEQVTTKTYGYASSVKVFDGASCSDLADCQQQCTDDPACEGYSSACSLTSKTTADTCGSCNVTGKTTELTCGTCVGDTSKETEAMCVSECQDSSFTTEATCGTCDDTNEGSSTTCVDTCYDYSSSVKVFDGASCSDLADCQQQCTDDPSCEGYTSACSLVDKTTQDTCGTCNVPGKSTELTCGTCNGDASKETEATCGTCPEDPSKLTSTTCVDTCYDYNSSLKVFSGSNCTDPSDCKTQCSADVDCEGFTSTCSDTSRAGTEADCGCSNPSITTESDCVTFQQLAASSGSSHTCAVLNDDTVKCWGSGSNGRLGYGDTSTRGNQANQMGNNLPTVDLGTGKTAKQVSASYEHTCAVLNDDTVKCWGKGNYGQLGYGDTNSRGDSGASATSCDDGKQMGDCLPVVDLGVNKTAKQVAAGGYHTCAILNDDTVKCWGAGNSGQLGYGGTSYKYSPPTATVDLGTCGTSTCLAKKIIAGSTHTCAVLNDDTVKCWGRGYYGQLGYGNTNNQNSPPTETVDLGTCGSSNCTAKQLVAGWHHTCAVLNDDTVKCWGHGESGKLGYGDTNNRGDSGAGATSCNEGKEMGDCLPTVDLGTCGSSSCTAKQVVPGRIHTCAVLNDDTVKCWGLGEYGRLGYGDTNSRGDSGASATSCNQGKEMGDCLPTVDLGTGKTAKQVVAGYYHTCAVLNDDTVKCWGWGGNGQLGNGSPDDKLSPPAATVDIGVLVTWSELSYTYGSQTADSGGTSEALVEVDCSGTIPRRINRTWTSSSWTAGTWDLATWNAQLSSAYAYGTESTYTGGTSQERSVASSCAGVPASRTFDRTWSTLTWTQRDWQVGSWENGEWNAQLSSAYAYGTKSADTGGTSQERSLDQTTVQYKDFCPSGTSTSSVSCLAMELSNNQSLCPSTHVFGTYEMAYEPSCTASDYKTCEAIAAEDETLCLEQGCADGSTKDKAACEAAGEIYDSSTAANVFYHTEQVNSEAECDGEHTWGYKKFTIRV